MNPWIWIAAGGIFEASWAVTLKLSDSFTVLSWTLLTIAINFVSIWFLNHGLKAGAPVGGAYAVWTGCGTLFSVIAGLLFFDETMTPLGWLFFAMVVAGALMMQSTDGQQDQ